MNAVKDVIAFFYVHNDEGTRKIKGINRPFISAYERMAMLSYIEAVNYAFVLENYNDNIMVLDYKLLTDIEPNIYFCLETEEVYKRISKLQPSFPNIDFEIIDRQSKYISTTFLENKFQQNEIFFRNVLYINVNKELEEKYHILTEASQLSNCKLAKVSAIIKITNGESVIGYNHRYGDCKCWCETKKEVNNYNHDYCSAIHAEEDAIIKALSKNLSLINAEVFCLYAPCYHCAKLLANMGISKLYYFNEYTDTNGILFLCKHSVEVFRCLL